VRENYHRPGILAVKHYVIAVRRILVLNPLPLGFMPELRATVEGSAGGFPLQIGQLADAVFRPVKFIASEFEGV
jgi:hypothetical protein